jgi:hypothetical protein
VKALSSKLYSIRQLANCSGGDFLLGWGYNPNEKGTGMKLVQDTTFKRALLSGSAVPFLLTLLSIAVSAQSQTSAGARGALKPQEIAATPPMGWNSWNHFRDKVDDATIRAQAEAMVSSGMRDAGYMYINIDDTWEGERDSSGIIHSNSKFSRYEGAR